MLLQLNRFALGDLDMIVHSNARGFLWNVGEDARLCLLPVIYVVTVRVPALFIEMKCVVSDRILCRRQCGRRLRFEIRSGLWIHVEMADLSLADGRDRRGSSRPKYRDHPIIGIRPPPWVVTLPHRPVPSTSAVRSNHSNTKAPRGDPQCV
jgi:hypothetical protein